MVYPTDTDIPISVRVPFATSLGMVYLWLRYRRDAASSPSGPPDFKFL